MATRLGDERGDVFVSHGLFLGRWANAVGSANPERFRELRRAGEDALKAGVILMGDGATEALYLLGLFLSEERERLPGAASALRESFRLDPQGVRKAYNAGLAYQQIGERVQAESLLLAAFDLAPEDADVLDALSILYMQGENWTSALRFQELLSVVAPERTDLAEREVFIRSKLQ